MHAPHGGGLLVTSFANMCISGSFSRGARATLPLAPRRSEKTPQRTYPLSFTGSGHTSLRRSVFERGRENCSFPVSESSEALRTESSQGVKVADTFTTRGVSCEAPQQQPLPPPLSALCPPLPAFLDRFRQVASTLWLVAPNILQYFFSDRPILLLIAREVPTPCAGMAFRRALSVFCRLSSAC